MTGNIHLQAAFRYVEGQLQCVRVPGHNSSWIEVHCAIEQHPLLGAAHRIVTSTGAVTFMAAIDWAAPTTIPAIIEPQRLPAMCGGLLLNTIAELAQHAGVAALRYRGAYPTAALFASLQPCFSCTATEAEFTAGGWQIALQGVAIEVPVDFVPTPFVRIQQTPRVVTQSTARQPASLQSVFIDGLSFAPMQQPRRLVAANEGYAAQLCFGDAAWATVATFAAEGQLAAGPHVLPALDSALAQQVLGRELPPPLRAALAELLADDAPAGLAPLYAKVASATPMVWRDVGMHAAILRDADGGPCIELHVALWTTLAPRGAAALVQAMATAIAPLVTRLVQQALLAAVGASGSGT
jgi:hypothetical protein